MEKKTSGLMKKKLREKIREETRDIMHKIKSKDAIDKTLNNIKQDIYIG